MNPDVTQEQNKLADRLLERNMSMNNTRILAAMAVVAALILLVTTGLYLAGIATKAITAPVLFRTGLICFVLLLLLWWIITRTGSARFTKWIVVTTVFVMMMVLRTAPIDAPETHAVFYMAIVMSLFYFDFRLLLYCTALCVAGDIFLLHTYPTLMPPGTAVVSLIIRYLCYLWVGIAAAIGSRATKELIRSATELKSANERLKEDIERKNKLDRLRKDFFTGASHELQSPISLIEGYAEGLRDNVIRGEERDYCVEVIIDEARKMGRLVNDMLDLSKLESGYLRMEFRDFYIDSLVANIVRVYSKAFEEKNINLDTSCSHEEILAFGDPLRIENVISNYLNNALRYSPEGGKVRVSVIQSDSKAIVEVDNEGERIEESDLDKIWTPFYRAERSRNRKLGGTGMGLAIVKTIVSLHNGEYGVKNTERGVRFFFSLDKPNLNITPS